MNNLIVWSLQLAFLVAVGAVMDRVLGSARARLWFWQGLLVVAILLPAVEPWSQPPPVVMEAPLSHGTAAATGYVAVEHLPFWRTLGWSEILIEGAGLRFAWLAVGLLRLRRLRAKARGIAAPVVAYDDRVTWYASEEISGPVTFGRTVLLPTRVLDMPMGMRDSIARHEMLHVERGDWWFVMAEEFVRGVLWFHPGVWFALSRIQLAREQVVDREVVEGTHDQAGYLEALVAVATQRMRPDLAPAPLFLKKRQLAARVAAILKEVPMSRTRLMARGAVAGCAMAAAGAAGVWMFPLVGSAQTVEDGPGITVNAGAALLHRTAVLYPAGVTATGTITVDASINAKGEVTDARVVSGPEELRKSVLANVLNWHYSSQPAPPTGVRVTVMFTQAGTGVPRPPGASSSTLKQLLEQDAVARGGGRGGVPAPPSPPPPPPPPPPPTTGRTRIGSITFSGISPELQARIEQTIGVKVDDPLPDLSELRAKVRALDEHVGISGIQMLDGKVTLQFSIRGVLTSLAGTPPPPPLAPPAGAQQVSSAVAKKFLMSQVPPNYPPIAKQARVQGVVVMSVVVGKEGTVEQISTVSGPAMLRDAAMDAVRQWTYWPLLLNGQPVPMVFEVEVNFALQ